MESNSQEERELVIGSKVKLLTGGWDGWGFDESVVIKIYKKLIKIKGNEGNGHEMVVRRNEIQWRDQSNN